MLKGQDVFRSVNMTTKSNCGLRKTWKSPSHRRQALTGCQIKAQQSWMRVTVKRQSESKKKSNTCIYGQSNILCNQFFIAYSSELKQCCLNNIL